MEVVDREFEVQGGEDQWRKRIIVIDELVKVTDWESDVSKFINSVRYRHWSTKKNKKCYRSIQGVWCWCHYPF